MVLFVCLFFLFSFFLFDVLRIRTEVIKVGQHMLKCPKNPGQLVNIHNTRTALIDSGYLVEGCTLVCYLWELAPEILQI